MGEIPGAGHREFYLREGGLLVWVFANFDADARRLTFDDIFYNNNQNAFVVNEHTVAVSLERGEFMLECIWAEPLAGGRVTPLKRAVISFHELTLDRANQQAFHFDSRRHRARLEAEAEGRRKALRGRFEAFWLAFASRGLGGPVDLSAWRSLRADFASVGVHLPTYPEKLPVPLINALYPAKYGRPVGWRFRKLVEVAHWMALAHREHLQAFRATLAVYGRGDQLLAEDKTGKWRTRVRAYLAAMANGDPAYEQDRRSSSLVAVLFPELPRDPSADRSNA